MRVSYKPLWKLMIDKDIKQKDLRESAKISSSTFDKLRKDKNVTTDVLLRICYFLDCDFADIMKCEKEEN